MLSAAPDHLPALYLSGIISYATGLVRGGGGSAAGGDGEGAGQYERAARCSPPLISGADARRRRSTSRARARQAPDDPALLRAAAEIQLASNNPTKAAELYERATALDKGNAASRVRLAQVRLAAGATLRPRSATSRTSRAPILRSRQPDLALDQRAPAPPRDGQGARGGRDIRQEATHESACVQREGRRLLEPTRLCKAARTSFEQALKVDPNYVAASYNLAQIDLVAAQLRCRAQALRADARQGSAQRAGAARDCERARRRPTRRPRRSRPRSTAAIAANPGSVRARLALISYYAQQRDGNAALAAAQAATARFPAIHRLLEALGATQQAAGETNQALETYGASGEAAAGQCGAALAARRRADGDARTTTGRSRRCEGDRATTRLRRRLGRAGQRLCRSRTHRCGPRRCATLQKDMPTKRRGYALEGESADGSEEAAGGRHGVS